MTLTELIAAATPGEWHVESRGVEVTIRDADGVPIAEMWVNGKPYVRRDAALIVAAVNKLPALIAALKAADRLSDKFLHPSTDYEWSHNRELDLAYDAARAAVGEV